MSESKANVALGVSSVALIAAGASFVYTNNQVNPLAERIEILEEDMANIAMHLHELKSVYTSEMARSKQSLKALRRKADKLEKKINNHEDVHEEINSIKERINALAENLGTDMSLILTPEVKEEKPKPTRAKASKKSHKKKYESESGSDSDSDSGVMDDYIKKLRG